MLSSKSVRSVFATAALAMMASACGGGTASPPPEPFSGDISTVLTIEIQNQQLEDARVYLIVDGQRERLGSIRGNQSETFHVPMEGIRSVHMEFDITLGPHCVTRDVTLGPGDNVGATIPSMLTAFQGICR
jgi:hypothetical protein